jgi:hypothetical protein
MAAMSLPHLVFTTKLSAVGEGSAGELYPVKMTAARMEQQRRTGLIFILFFTADFLTANLRSSSLMKKN